MSRIPKFLHYCFGFSEDFGGKPLGLSHYVCIRSAIERLSPERVNFYYEYEPTGPWWSRLREIVEPIRITAPREIFGRPLAHPAHRADITRLRALIEHGGIYMDTDVFVHRSFDHLLGHSTVLGREGEESDAKLCNAVILAEPQAPFLRRWLGSYSDFRGKGRGLFWNEHSVLRPALLADKYPDEITILSNRAFFWPLFWPSELARIFSSKESIVGPETLATHLWENKAWRPYLELLTPGRLRRTQSNFADWSIPLLAGLPDDFAAPTVRRKLQNGVGRLDDVRVEVLMKLSNLPNKLRGLAR
ncbi:MAG TPA: glycosyltransferase [Candidatus Saccharimonadales bacterium]|nr:glycosyltransferase [Candidatus Saccharimonadales bacterium]